MDRALRVLAALFATAAALMLVAILLMLTQHILPAFDELRGQPKNAALIGLLLGYWVMFMAVYGLAGWFVWKKSQWKWAFLLAVTSCFGFPVGPVLGFAAIVILTRPPVRAQFRS